MEDDIPIQEPYIPLVQVRRFQDYDDYERLVNTVNKWLEEHRKPNIKIRSVRFIRVNMCFVEYEIYGMPKEGRKHG